MTAQLDTQRLDVVAAKAVEWRKRLIDFSSRNTLLHFRNTKTGMLDLTDAEPSSLGEFQAGVKVRLRLLVPDMVEHKDACTRARSLNRRIQMFEEEQGIDVGRAAFGLLKTLPTQHKGRTPVPVLRAPLLLQPVSIRARTASESDYTIELTDEIELNPVLLHALNEQYGIDTGDLRDALDEIALGVGSQEMLVEQIHAELARVASAQGIELELERATVLGTFNYEKLPMVEDLAHATELLASHDLVAAMAGYGPAKARLLACLSWLSRKVRRACGRRPNGGGPRQRPYGSSNATHCAAWPTNSTGCTSASKPSSTAWPGATAA